MNNIYAIVIVIEGGIIQAVYENGSGAKYPYLVMDKDCEESCPDEVFSRQGVDFTLYSDVVLKDEELVNDLLAESGIK